MMNNLIKKYIPEPNLINILYLGIISGLPFSVLYTAIIVWLKEGGYELEIVTTLAAARIPYSFKYLWSPFIDGFQLPILGRLGRRKSWIVFITAIMSFILVCFASINSENNFQYIYLLSLLFGFLSASLDIVIDAYRIDNIEIKYQGYASTLAILGYRVGALISSSGILILSDQYSWNAGFLMLAAIMASATLYVPFLKEIMEEIKYDSFKDRVIKTVINPFKDFFTKDLSILILAGILLYKVCDVLLGFVSVPFYLELGYTKTQIGTIVKFYGFFATILGSFLGGYIISRIGVMNGVIVAGIFQCSINSIFIWLHYAPVVDSSLLIAISAENLGVGLGASALVTYMSALCNRKYSATQYALLTSVAAFVNSVFSIKAGSLVKILGWDMFFIFTIFTGLPSLVIFYYIDKKTKK